MAAIERSFDTSGPLALVLKVSAGEVDLETAGGDGAHVEVEPLNDAARDLLDEVRVELRGHELEIEAPGRRSVFGFRSPEFRVAVRMPDGSDVRVKVVSADVEARGRYGKVELQAASGDFRLEGDVDQAQVHTASGDLSLESVSGDARVHSASGDVRFGHVGGAVSAHLASGDLTVDHADGSVEARSASGDLTVGSVAAGSASLTSASGDIVVGIRRGSRVWIDAESASGSTSSDLDLSDDAPSGDEDDGPLVEIRARSASGDIRIVRAGAAKPS
ncbi:MAG: hypothetical protein QOE36_3526 [Gaiellaceae bacterium]|jgi:hypothetical protein|nr:hypothetical protein [Gaiellaceae bacterium]